MSQIINFFRHPNGWMLLRILAILAFGCTMNPAGIAATLDQISAPSAAAFSLSKLRAAYTGSAVRVRRSSDNAEANIGFTANGDLDTAALLAHVGSGASDNGFVTTWYDQSGNGRDVTQATAANQPQIVSNGAIETQNGRPMPLFDGTDFLSFQGVHDQLWSLAVVGTSELSFQRRRFYGQCQRGNCDRLANSL